MQNALACGTQSTLVCLSCLLAKRSSISDTNSEAVFGLQALMCDMLGVERALAGSWQASLELRSSIHRFHNLHCCARNWAAAWPFSHWVESSRTPIDPFVLVYSRSVSLTDLPLQLSLLESIDDLKRPGGEKGTQVIRPVDFGNLQASQSCLEVDQVDFNIIVFLHSRQLRDFLEPAIQIPILPPFFLPLCFCGASGFFCCHAPLPSP